MKLGSLFDGSGGFPLSGVLNGIEPVWAAEVEPYPIAVTRSRFPHMKHYGNVCKINGAEIEPVDIITFGSPCQDLSVAGKRAGIQDGERSNLFFEAVRIIKEMREATNGEYPKYAVWENVPGAFSSNKGHDFHAVLEALCSVRDSTVSIPKPYDAKRADKLVWLGAGEIVGDNYSIAWRTLDAQYWGVPQRRKRIYLVADFTGRRAGEILFKPDSLRGNLPQGNEAGQGSAVDAVGSVDGSVGNCLTPWDYQNKRLYSPDGVYPTLPSIAEGSGQNAQAVIYEPASLLEENWQESEVKNALRANASKSSHAVVQSAAFMGGQGAKARSIAYNEEIAPTIKSALSGGNTVPDVVIAFSQNQRDEVRDLGDKAGALAAEAGAHQQTYVCQEVNAIATQLCGDRSNPNVSFSEELAYCLPANPMSDRGQVIALQANGIDRADTAGCNGCGWREDEMYTLNTVDRHAVCFDRAAVAKGSGGVCYGIGNGQADQSYLHDKMRALNCMHDQQAVCYENYQHGGYKEGCGTFRASGGDYGGGSENLVCYPEKSGTLCASGAGLNRPAGQCNETDMCVVQTSQPPRRYIIRRLMPIECARLQGFPDAWGELAPYDGDDEFWEGVRKTHAEINGKKYKPVKNLKRWYDKLHNDGAEYKMWGNGIALPCAEYVIRMIKEEV